MENNTIRRILPLVNDFKSFWKKKGPFKYALTSAEFPPVLLEPEEWIFSDNITMLLKELMQWSSRRMTIVKAPFNKNRKNILKPDNLIPWKIDNFPQEWESAVCDIFTPVGYLTDAVTSGLILSDSIDNCTGVKSEERAGTVDQTITTVEEAFFQSLEANIGKIGYLLLKPEPILKKYEEAYIDDYLQEWQADEDEG